MSAAYAKDNGMSPANLVVVSSEEQPSIPKSVLRKSFVLQGLLGHQQDLVLPVSPLGLQQWKAWALSSATSGYNCFSALNEGVQVGVLPAWVVRRRFCCPSNCTPVHSKSSTVFNMPSFRCIVWSFECCVVRLINSYNELCGTFVLVCLTQPAAIVLSS